jgi:hypothetical protein
MGVVMAGLAAAAIHAMRPTRGLKLKPSLVKVPSLKFFAIRRRANRFLGMTTWMAGTSSAMTAQMSPV